ncbi:MAG TPA: hypothetical protein VFJ19_01575 [Nocardioidaceae bacterium]|nr:hypothetical protein [Nocardioidaceae bacterium]
MMINMTSSQQARFAMPVRPRVSTTWTPELASAAAAGSTCVLIDGTGLSAASMAFAGYRHIDGAAVKDTFPGLSAWSPPI